MSPKKSCAPQPWRRLSERDISEDRDRTKGRYVPRQGGALTYSVLSEATRIAGHTAVPDVMRGTGAVAALVAHLVADARAKGFKVVPLCPFVNRERARHPDWADAFSV